MNRKNKVQQIDKKKSKRREELLWSLKLALIACLISVVFSFISEIAMKNVNILIGTIVIIVFILIGILFDMVGVAVTSADEAPLHAMSSKKVKGSKMAVNLKKNASKTSTFCCDVIGDICGIISGAAGVVVSNQITDIFNISSILSSLIVTGIIAALTIGGKSVEKPIAINNGNKILFEFSKIISIFSKNNGG